MHSFRNKEGEKHLIVPVGLVALDEQTREVCSNAVQSDRFGQAKRFGKEEAITPEQELQVIRFYAADDNLTRDGSFYDRNEFQHSYRR